MDEKKDKIQETLHQFANGNLADNAKHLLNVLGYESKRTMRLEPNTPDGFLSAFNLNDDAKFNSERALTEEWESVDLLFQITDEEISEIAILRSTSEKAALTGREWSPTSFSPLS